MKIAIAQLNIKCGQLSINFNKIRLLIDEAKRKGAELIVFPALAVSGLCVGDKWLEEDFKETIEHHNDEIIKMSDSIDILFGSIYRQHNMLFSATYLASNGSLIKANTSLDAILKDEPSCFKGFDEDKWFTFGAGKQYFEYKGMKLGVSIADEFVANDDVDLQIVLANKPYTFQSEKAVRGKYLFVNSVGTQNTGNSIFVIKGNSGYYQDGKKIWGADTSFSEQLIVSELDGKDDNESEQSMLDALCCGIREFDQEQFAGSVKWIIGLSGGLDSSVTASLLVRALGTDRVVGYNMATHYNSIQTKDNARNLANRLGMEIREGSIEPVVNATVQVLKEYGYTDEYPSLVYENIQARIRGHMLSTFASVENGVISNNGNKVETALGYCTLYGDSIGALCPLADLTKVQLFDLSREINKAFNKEIIPLNLLPVVTEDGIDWETPPSAELRDAQRDPMKWFYHDYIIDHIMSDPDYLIKLLRSYKSKAILTSPIGRWIKYYGLDNPKAFIEDIEWIRKNMQRNIFKRVQAPPIIALSDYAFGSTRYEVQGRVDNGKEYEKLKNDILNS